MANGSPAARRSLQPPKHKRLSEVTDEVKINPKRISAASTSTDGSNGSRRRKTHIGPWQLGQTVGKGGTSRVRKVRHVVTGEHAVAKIVGKAVAEKARSMSLANLVRSAENGDPSLIPAGGKVIPFGLEREIVIMKLLNHPNIVRLYDVWENRNELYLIMEYAEGVELFEYVARQHRLEEREAVYLFRQIIAALLYCQRLRIHHRDLKPENILLNPKTFEIKIVDFGMAALQPLDGKLTTPCGSPHYAAPEVIQSRPYDGEKADIWSCGVILFLTITGFPPFNYPKDPRDKMTEDQKLRGLFKAICSADYKFPSGMSPEAKDLIKKIFIIPPEKRISVEQVWNHPLLHKYDRDFGFTDDKSTAVETWIGPGPKIEQWRPLTVTKIDREIFRNLRTLWHSEREDVIIARLLNSEFNQEKYFYSQLLKYREENWESMQSTTPLSVRYSTSDYQHLNSTPVPPTPSLSEISHVSGHQRSKSQYSVSGNEHLYSRHSFVENPPSEASYDPFRVSREPVAHPKNGYSVIVHRTSSRGSSRIQRRLSSHGNQPSSLRIEALRQQASRKNSGLSSRTNSVRAASHRSSLSKTSIQSGRWLGNPPTMRPSSIHKRGVSFSHLHKSTTGSARAPRPASERPICTPERGLEQLKQASNGSATTPSPSPRPPPMPTVASKKEGKATRDAIPNPRAKKAKDLEADVRKISLEIEKACEEAFYRSSMSESTRTSITDRPSPFADTPPSSLTNTCGSKNRVHFVDKAVLASRPLPPTPDEVRLSYETPRSYTTREVAELRNRLASKYAKEGLEDHFHYNEILKQLDTLMYADGGTPGDARRALSAPQPSPGQHSLETRDAQHHLHVIPEEGRFVDAEDVSGSSHLPVSPHLNNTNTTHRAVTEPFATRDFALKRIIDKTIRVVPPSSPPVPPSPSPWAPLNIRKRSNGSGGSETDVSPRLNSASRSSRGVQPAIDELQLSTPYNKRSVGWFRRGDGSKGLQDDARTKPRRITDKKMESKYSHLDDRIERRDQAYLSQDYDVTPAAKAAAQENGTYRTGSRHNNSKAAKKPEETQASEETAKSKQASVNSQSKWLKPFKRQKAVHVYGLRTNQGASDGFRGDVMESPTRAVTLLTPHQSDGDRNVLRRLLVFKPKRPEQQLIPLNINRIEAFNKVYEILHNDTMVGITDLARSEDIGWELTAAIQEPNHFKLKACRFAIESFGIDKNGVNGRVCVIRITQLREDGGSAKSIRIMARNLRKALEKSRPHWIEHNKAEAKAICDVMKNIVREVDMSG